MPAKRRQDIGEDLEDADDEKAHDNPLADLLGLGGLDEAAEAKTQDGDGQRHHDGCPNGKAFAEGAFVDHKSKLHLIHIRLPLLKAEGLIERIGLRARGVRGEAKVDGREFASGEVNDALQEGTADPLAPIGR